jgi:hypothetical protein
MTFSNLNELFAYVMNTKGHSTEFRGMPIPTQSFAMIPASMTHVYLTGVFAPKHNSKAQIVEIGKWIKETRGKELPALFNPNLIQKVFRYQSTDWEDIATSHLENVCSVVRQSLSAMALHVANEDTASRLLRDVVDVELDKKQELMMAKLREVLFPYHRLHPITYNRTFGTKKNSNGEPSGPSAIQESDSGAAWDIFDAANTYYEVCP